MPKFIIKHGCCYIPPIENTSSTTYQVYSNPEFSKYNYYIYSVVPSDPFCGKGKSSPEFNQERNIISWAHLDYTPEESNKAANISLKSSSQASFSNTQEKCALTKENPHNLITLYGYDRREIKGFTNNVSDTSIYKPTTSKNSEISIIGIILGSEKMLDCLSSCLWKCSAWCQ